MMVVRGTRPGQLLKGFQQKKGIDYTEIFSPIVKLSTIRVILSIRAVENLYLEQLDVTTAFLHDEIDEDIYVQQPIGFVVSSKEDLVCKLRKSLYGLKQALRLWYKKFDGFMTNNVLKNMSQGQSLNDCAYLVNCI